MCGCHNTTYYGQGQRRFTVRASEHLGITPLTVKFVKTPKKSAILIICYWMRMKLVLTIFRYFQKKAIHLNYS